MYHLWDQDDPQSSHIYSLSSCMIISFSRERNPKLSVVVALNKVIAQFLQFSSLHPNWHANSQFVTTTTEQIFSLFLLVEKKERGQSMHDLSTSGHFCRQKKKKQYTVTHTRTKLNIPIHQPQFCNYILSLRQNQFLLEI